MSFIINYCKAGLTLLVGVLGWLFGGFDSLIYALIAFVVIDYITGVLLAICNKKVSSKIGYKGISKKVFIFLLVGAGNIADKYIIGTGSSLKSMLIMFYLSNEGISIIENAGNLGLPMPQKLKDIFKEIGKNDKSGSN